MRASLKSRWILKTVAAFLLLLFSVWSFAFSLHFLFAKNHYNHDHCHYCSGPDLSCAQSSSASGNFSFVPATEVSGEHCLLCLFASELDGVKTSVVFSLARETSVAFLKRFELLTHFSCLFIANFSRGPPVNFV